MARVRPALSVFAVGLRPVVGWLRWTTVTVGLAVPPGRSGGAMCVMLSRVRRLGGGIGSLPAGPFHPRWCGWHVGPALAVSCAFLGLAGRPVPMSRAG